MGYGQSSSPLDSIKKFIKRGGMPVSYTLIGINIVTFLISWFWFSIPSLASRQNPFDYLVFNSSTSLLRPWTMLTYPLPGTGPLDVIFDCIGLWLIGGSLERAWGATRFMAVLSCLTIVSAFSLQLIGFLIHFGIAEAGYRYPLTSLLVVFCLINSEVTLRPYGLFSIRGKYLAIAVVVLTYFSAGYGAFYNFIALAGCGAAYVYHRFGRSYSYLDTGYSGRASSAPDLRIFDTRGRRTKNPGEILDGSAKPPSIFNIPAQIKYRKERRRLEEFFRKSGMEDKNFRDSD
jgi:membrane associated rhomboid family serine protease